MCFWSDEGCQSSLMLLVALYSIFKSRWNLWFMVRHLSDYEHQTILSHSCSIMVSFKWLVHMSTSKSIRLSDMVQ